MRASYGRKAIEQREKDKSKRRSKKAGGKTDSEVSSAETVSLDEGEESEELEWESFDREMRAIR